MEACKPVPLLMVFYESSATQFQFSDGSRLRLAPCGTVFSYQSPAYPQDHPIQEKPCILQRTQYVTSAYRNKVSQAVGFRNLFAECPFLCKSLLEEESQEIKLYSVVKNIKWARSLDVARPKLEYFEDGSVRLTSEDEYASLQLSPHHRDFTVCYLSLVKPISQTDSVRIRKPKDDLGRSELRPESPKCSELADTTTTSLASTLSQYRTSTPINQSPEDLDSENLNSSKYRPHKAKGVKGYLSNVDVNAGSFLELLCLTTAVGEAEGEEGKEEGKEGEGKERLQKERNGEDRKGKEVLEKEGKERKKGKGVAEGNRERKGKERLQKEGEEGKGEEEEKGEEEGKGEERKEILQKERNGEDRKGKEVLEKERKEKGKDLKEGEEEEKDRKGKEVLEKERKEEKSFGMKTSGNKTICAKNNESMDGRRQTKQESAPIVTKWNLDEKNRLRYTWITQHISANECPQIWYHPFQIALQAAQEHQQKMSGDATDLCLSKNDEDKQKNEKNQFVVCSLPKPVPLKCPGQHLHKWLNSIDSKHQQLWPVLVGSNVQLETDLRQGRLKVLVMSGVVYRFIYLSQLTILEIYPGDGSVIISQGFSGHYFSHITFHKGQISERVHSVKAPPPLSSKHSYSVARLIDYGCRLLRTATQVTFAQPLLVCWKYEVNRILEPLPLILLEECTVPSLGRFQAYSNGWIHVVFEDRTTLDMNWDLTQHLRWWLDHQPYEIDMAEERIKLTMSKCESNICRLLLPSGHDRLVDIKHPNIYSQYVQPSVEWAQWVNCLPSERLRFQKAVTEEEKEMKLVDRELRKINCFDYLVKNTLGKQLPATKVPSNSHVSEDSAFFSDRSVCKSSDVSSSAVRQNAEEHRGEKGHSAKIEELLTTEVFDQNSVRAALLLTSRAILDIDCILETK